MFVEHCAECHGAKKQSAGLRLDTVAGIKKGADDGPVVIAGKPKESRLVKSIRREGDNPMPPKTILSDESVGILTEWVKRGAVLPAETVAAKGNGKDHWAFQPVVDPKVPTTPGAATPIDAFVRMKLATEKLPIGTKADKRALIRRAYFDLTSRSAADREDEFDAFEDQTQFADRLRSRD